MKTQVADNINRKNFWWAVFKAAFVVLVGMVLLITNGPIYAPPRLLDELYKPATIRIVMLPLYAAAAMAYLALHRLAKLD